MKLITYAMIIIQLIIIVTEFSMVNLSMSTQIFFLTISVASLMFGICQMECGKENL